MRRERQTETPLRVGAAVPARAPDAGGKLWFGRLAESRKFAEFALILKRLTGFSMALNMTDVSVIRIGVPRDTGNPLCAMMRATPEGVRRCGSCDRSHHARASRGNIAS